MLRDQSYLCCSHPCSTLILNQAADKITFFFRVTRQQRGPFLRRILVELHFPPILETCCFLLELALYIKLVHHQRTGQTDRFGVPSFLNML